MFCVKLNVILRLLTLMLSALLFTTQNSTNVKGIFFSVKNIHKNGD